MLRDKHKADLEQSLQTFQATMSEQQALSQMLIRGQEEFITKATEAVDRLPQRNDFRAIIKLLIAAIAMMVVQVIITGVVVYGIFTR
jgi:cytochrome b subunit of formate dehydrogenase